MFRRIAIIATGTVGGVAAVLAYHPPSLTPVSTIGVAAPAPASTGTSSGTKKPAATKPGAKTPAATQSTSAPSGTYSGDTAPTAWGPVQVQITVSGGQIMAAKALQWPNGDRRSQSIAQQSIPYLIQQTLTTKSANVLGVSGASYTSDGWRRSLASARSKAGI
jgi:uncharacterized protein with FMN-binding domain